MTAFLGAFIPAFIGVVLLFAAYAAWLGILAIFRTLTKKGN